jgi:hypothetical protein
MSSGTWCAPVLGLPMARVRLPRSFAAWPVVLGLLCVGIVPAQAQMRGPDAEAARVVAAGHSLKWNWTPPGLSDRYGHAETLIRAGLPAVRDQVRDYGRYRDFVPGRFKTSRIVGHAPDGSTDVYLQIAVLHGMVTLWDVTRFAPPRNAGPGAEVIAGRMVPGKGNIDDFDVVWTLRQIDEERTFLKVDMLLKPGLPAPQSAIDEELRDCAMYAVDGIHDRLEPAQ